MINNAVRNIIKLVLISCMLTACLSPVKTETMSEYVVNTVPAVYKSRGNTGEIITISTPVTNAIYQTNEMAYSTKEYQINYFAKNRWAEAPAQMIQSLLIETMQKTGHYKAVVPAKAISKSDLLLNTQLFEFQQVFVANCSLFKIKLRAQLVNSNTGRIIASKTFVAEEPAHQNNPYSGVIAANKATANVLSQLAAWLRDY